MLGKGLQLAHVSELSKLARSVGRVRLCWTEADLAGDDLLLLVDGCCWGWFDIPIGCISIKVAGPAAMTVEEQQEE